MKTVLPFGSNCLRPVTKTDAGKLLALLTTPEVRRFLCDDKILTTPEIAAFLADSNRRDAEGLGLWVIETDAKDITGIASLMPVTGALEDIPEMAGGIEPTIALGPRFWRQGLALRALAAVIDHARDTLCLSKLVASVDVPNKASHRLLRSCGFQKIGRSQGVAHELILYVLPLKQLAAD
ncbi:GNAT family N-acetyltransferase [Ruegeria sp. 2205SS24-7]|uniref:GNAT family N-acetyltransferase n=1 Tax=Ruegeria discodermiae TaxID=3064389 RepID=UPI002741433E|nr:GNAT family N-acetyltransferase [Ruegeria sp. 2205SS24-7]MDP5218763.1 GNAT family N-acetyltransferase [Ruegeria sp. 2205SS24-7]